VNGSVQAASESDFPTVELAESATAKDLLAVQMEGRRKK